MTEKRRDPNLHAAPRFHALLQHLEGRGVMPMPRSEWRRLADIQPGDMIAIDVSEMPIGSVTAGARVEAAVAIRRSEGEVSIDVYRYDVEDLPNPINVDSYRVWEALPPHRDYLSIVSAASTHDDANLRAFLQDYVFLVKSDADPQRHHLSELPATVKAAMAQRIRGAA